MKDQTVRSQAPEVFIAKVGGETVLIVSAAPSFFKETNKAKCVATFNQNADRILHFKNRIAEKQSNPADVVIVVINVDDSNGALIADALMPGFNWQEIRDRGETPFARGLAMRVEMKELLNAFDKEAAEKFDTILEYAVIVVDHGVAEIFSA